MANHSAQFETEFDIGLESTYGTAAGTLSAVPTTDEPTLDLAPAAVEIPTFGRGTSEPQDEDYAVGTLASKAGFKCRPDDLRLKHVFSSLFQKNSGFAATPFLDTFTPYLVQPGTFRGYTLRKLIVPSSATGCLQMTGAICTMAKIGSTEGQFQYLETEWMGLAGTQLSATSPGTYINGAKKFMHYDAVLTVGGAVVKPTAVEVQFINNTGAFYGTSQSVTDLYLGNVKISGSFTVSSKQSGLAEFANLINRTTRTFKLEYGTSGSTGYQDYEFDAVYQAGQPVQQNGLEIVQFTFAGVKKTTSVAVKLQTVAAFS